MASYSNRGTVKKRVTADTTVVQPMRKVMNDRFTGYGMIEPGAHPERQEITPFGNAFKQIGSAVKYLGNIYNKVTNFDPYKKKAR